MQNQIQQKILIVLHRSCGDMGKVGQILEQRGYRLDICCTLEGDSLPDPSDYAGVVVFGGAMSVNDCDKLSGIQAEIDWIPTVISAKVPYLGICLGAQLLAKALGAGVAKKTDETVEIGFYPVYPTKKGSNFLPEQGLRFYQWHLEGFSLPKDCQKLAESDSFPNQAFMLNEKTIGLQFHPEVTRPMIDCWVQREAEDLRLQGAQSYKTQVELFRECDVAVTEWLEDFLTKWLS